MNRFSRRDALGSDVNSMLNWAKACDLTVKTRKSPAFRAPDGVTTAHQNGLFMLSTASKLKKLGIQITSYFIWTHSYVTPAGKTFME